MSIDIIFPAAQAAIAGAQDANGVPLLKGVSDGASQAVPETPFAWMQVEGFTSPPLSGSDLEQTNWNLTIRLLARWAADPKDAENVLRPIIEKLRAAIRAHIRLGIPAEQADAIIARVTDGRWGYVAVNGITYRFVDLGLTVTEKLRVSFAA